MLIPKIWNNQALIRTGLLARNFPKKFYIEARDTKDGKI